MLALLMNCVQIIPSIIKISLIILIASIDWPSVILVIILGIVFKVITWRSKIKKGRF